MLRLDENEYPILSRWIRTQPKTMTRAYKGLDWSTACLVQKSRLKIQDTDRHSTSILFEVLLSC